MCATASACVPITPTAALVRARRPPIWLIPRWLCGGACWRACGGRREHAQAGSSHPARSCEAPVGHPSSAAPRARLTEGRRTLRGAAGAHRGCLDRGWPTRIQTSRRIRAASEGRARASKPDWSCTRAGGGVSRTPDWLPLGLFLSPPSVPLDTSSAGGRPDSQEFLGLRWLVLAHSRRSLMHWRQHSGGAGREWPPARWKETGEKGEREVREIPARSWPACTLLPPLSPAAALASLPYFGTFAPLSPRISPGYVGKRFCACHVVGCPPPLRPLPAGYSCSSPRGGPRPRFRHRLMASRLPPHPPPAKSAPLPPPPYQLLR